MQSSATPSCAHLHRCAGFRTFFSPAVWFAGSLKQLLPVLINSDQPKAFVLVCPTNFAHQVARVKTVFLLKTESSTSCVSARPVLSTHLGWTGTAPYFRLLWPRCDTGMQMLMRVSTSSSLLQLPGPLHFCPSFSCSRCIMSPSSLYCIGVPIFFLWQLCQCLLTIFCLKDLKK